MADTKAIKDLVVCSFFGRTPDPTKYSIDDVNESIREEIHKIAYDYNSYRRNKLDLFEIMQEAYTEILPKAVEDFMGSFAEIKTVPLNQKAQFVITTGRRRAKQFVTAVGLSGAYESFRLDKNTFEVGGRAIGGTAYVDFERYTCGDEDLADSTSLLLEGLQEAIYGEIQRALLAAVDAQDRPAKNKAIVAGFDSDAMQQLCSVAGSYGNGGVTIFATPEFVAEMGPDAIGLPMAWNASSTGVATPVYNPRNIEEIAQYGRIKTFRGNPIVEMPQSYTDETNEVTVTNPSTAYIFPNGRTKPVKIVFEGDTQIDDFKNRDRSMEVEVYQRVGVAILTNYDWCVYVNTELQDPDIYPTKYATNFEADWVNPKNSTGKVVNKTVANG